MMYHIIMHCKPQKENEEFYGKVLGAYASVLIDYLDYDGVMVLSKYYIEQNGWEIIEIEDDYFTFERKEDLPENYHQYFDDLGKYGYSLIFNTYDNDEE